MGPFDYTIQTDPMAGLSGFQSGLNMRDQMQQAAFAQNQEARAQSAFDMAQTQDQQRWAWEQEDRARQQAEYEAQQAQQQQWQADIGVLSEKMATGALSSQDIAGYALKYPDHAGLIRETFDTFTADRKRNDALELSKSMLAIKAGRPEVAIEALKTRAEAAENMGNKEEADAYRSVAMQIEMDPNSGFILGGMILNELDPDMAKTVLDGGSGERKVQSTIDLGGGLTATVFVDGSKEVTDATGQKLEGKAAADAIRAAEDRGVELKRAAAGATAEGRLSTEIQLGGEAAAERAKGTEIGQSEGAKIAGADATIDTAQTFIDNIDTVLAPENAGALESITGNMQGRLPAGIPLITGGQAGADMSARLKQLDGQTFLDAYNGIRGAGAITQNEGEAAKSAANRLLYTEVGTAEYRKALADAKALLLKRIEKAKKLKGESPTDPAPSQSSGGASQGASSGPVQGGATQAPPDIDDLLKQYGAP